MADVPSIDQLLGPAGALALALMVIGGLVRTLLLLWRDHKQSDERERERTQQAEDRLDRALVTLKDHTDVTDRAVSLTEALVEKLEANRGR